MGGGFDGQIRLPPLPTPPAAPGRGVLAAILIRGQRRESQRCGQRVRLGYRPRPGSGGNRPPSVSGLLCVQISHKNGSTLGGRSPRCGCGSCGDEWAGQTARHAPAAGPWRACVRPRRPRPVAACAAIAGRVVPVARARAAAHRRAVSGHCHPRPRAGAGGPCAPYAVPRRTRRRGDAVRGAAGPAG